MAFTFRRFGPPFELLNDPKYVKWVAFDANYDLRSPKDTWPETVKKLSFHPCTEEDYEGFYPILDPQSKNDFDSGLKDDLFCFDEPDEYFSVNIGFEHSIFGRAVTIALYPCNQKNLFWFDDPEP